MDKIEMKNTLLGLTIRFVKDYRKNSFALIFSLLLSITLIFSILTLLHTNHRVIAKQNLFIYTAIDYEISGLDAEQIYLLKQNSEIKYLGIGKQLGNIQTKDSQRGILRASNSEEILAVAKLLKGRMPKKPQEIVAEKWALLNLGINPILDQEVAVPVSYNNSTNKVVTEKFKLVGIISDQAFHKRAAVVTLYTGLDMKNDHDKGLTASIAFSEGGNKQKLTKIKQQLNLRDKQIRENVWKENTKDLLLLDVQMGALMIAICAIVIFGIHRIALMVRKDQFGILRALGLTKKQIRKMILMELGGLTLVCLPIGIVAGYGCSYLVTLLSKDQNIDIYFWGKADQFDLIIPVLPIAICLLCFFLTILMVGYLGANAINAGSVTDTIFGNDSSGESDLHFFRLTDTSNKSTFYQQLGLKYIFRDLKTSLFIVMSLILTSTLFISLFYQAILAKENQQIRKTTSFYNSDYLLTTYDDLDARLGIKPEVFSKIEKIKGIKEIETQSALPVKVIDSGVDRNEQFLNEKDEIVLRNYGFSLTGKLQGEAVYHTKLKGYNSDALKKLKKYLKAGNFDPENLSENEVILAMPTTSTSGPSKGSVGYFKNGEQLMSYQLGQTLTVSYASNFETKSEDYWKMTDNQTDYSQKKMKILAIAYYPYMQEVSLIEQGYPLIIMSDQAYQKIVPRYTYETINVNANAELSNIQKESIEEQLIRLAVINQQVTARSLIAEKEQLYSIYRKEIVYVFGIALVVLLLVIINLINSLKYRIETRKRELYLFKALGLSFKGLEKMIAFETTLFVFVSIAISTAVSIIITKLQYNYSQIYLLGLRFDYPVLPVVGLNFCIFGLCYLISVNLARGLRSSNIIEEFNKLE